MGLGRYSLWWIPLEDKKHLDTICNQHGITYKEKKSKNNGTLEFVLLNEYTSIVIPYVRPDLYQGHMNELVSKWKEDKK